MDRYTVDVGIGGNLGAMLLVAPEDGANDVAVVEHTLPAGKLAAPLHRHAHEDEISYILDGTMGIQEGETVSQIEAGGIAVKERDTWHTFWNPGPGELRFLEIIAPGGFAGYFGEVAPLLPIDDDPDEGTRRRMVELREKYDLEMDPDSVPELLDRHGLNG